MTEEKSINGNYRLSLILLLFELEKKPNYIGTRRYILNMYCMYMGIKGYIAYV